MRSPKILVSFCLAAIIILAACGNPAAGPILPTATNQLPTESPVPKYTSTAVTPQPTEPPAATPTPIACLPQTTEYCIVDGSFVFQIPIAPPGTDTIDRYYPYGGTEGGKRDPHHGVEFYNGSGTPVIAAANGTVYFAGNDKGQLFSPWANFYGNLIILKHELPGTPFDTLYTLYAHLSKEDVTTGQSVTAGEKIGEVGSSGSAEGSHLHFEVRVEPSDYSSTLNPELWLRPHSGNGTLAIEILGNIGKNVFPPFSIQYYPNRNEPATREFGVQSYAPETVNPQDPWGDIASLGDQPAGWYRITFLWAGAWIERWVEIQPGKLTRVAFVIK
jgi:hypothetical protein